MNSVLRMIDEQHQTEPNAYASPESEDVITPKGALRPAPTIAGLFLWIAWLMFVLGVIVYLVG